MIQQGFVYAWQRFRPAAGWLVALLLLAIIILLAIQVSSADWVPEGNVAWLALVGLLLAAVLIRRGCSWPMAWSLMVAYGLLFTLLRLAHLWPSLATVSAGWAPTSFYMRSQWFLFVDRVAGWLAAVSSGARSQDTLVFAFGLGLLAWLLATLAAWTTFRWGRPLPGLLAVGLALALNSFYGAAPVTPLVLFVGLAALLIALSHLNQLERRWEATGTDYSTEIRFDLIIYGGAIAMLLMTLALLVPEINLRSVYRAIFDRPAVHQLENDLDRIFAGVQTARNQGPGQAGEGIASGGGALPRSFLLGAAPELYETVVLTATVAGERPTTLTHWRGHSYDIYTGRGWATSPERQEVFPAGQPLPQPAHQSQVPLSQRVSWVQGSNVARYTLGQPFSFDHDVTAFWRGSDDLSRVHGRVNPYLATALVSMATSEQLGQARPDDIPPVILARYTQLPDHVPERVVSLAREIVRTLPAPSSPYAKAQAIEKFLRQYPYSLDIDRPPAGVDVVDYFLFESQTGYCDYYASAMVILARVLGLPARLAGGYLAQPPDSNGVETIYQINAHSWAEIYFAGYGWIEFEPTAAFPNASPAGAIPPTDASQPPDQVPFQPLPIPERPSSPLVWLWLLAPLALVAGVGGWLWRRARLARKGLDDIQWAYSRLLHFAHQLGQPTPPSQTPAEFTTALLDWLQRGKLRSPAPAPIDLSQLQPDIEAISAAFMIRQYAGQPRLSRQTAGSEPASVAGSWKRLRWRLWLIGSISRLTRRWQTLRR